MQVQIGQSKVQKDTGQERRELPRLASSSTPAVKSKLLSHGIRGGPFLLAEQVLKIIPCGLVEELETSMMRMCIIIVVHQLVKGLHGVPVEVSAILQTIRYISTF